MLRSLVSLYRPRYARTLAYMLQNTEYEIGPYLRWWWRTNDFATVMKRRTLNRTRVARTMLLSLELGMALQYLAALSLAIVAARQADTAILGLALALGLVTPILWAHAAVVPLLLGRWLVIGPRQKMLVAQSRQIFAEHPAIKIAIAGSYGKTSMKELLATVLGEGMKVAATPGNKNVAISHAYFAKRLAGDEEALIIEYGEGAPGDVAAFAANTKPTHAVITGVAPAHLDHYKTLQAAGEDIFSVSHVVPAGHTHVNGSSEAVMPFLNGQELQFNDQQALGYTISNIKLSLTGTDFTLSKGKQILKLHSDLIGRHQVPTLAFVAAFALQVGLSKDQVIAGVAKTKPYEHRMQPYQLGGAWIIDDTYNGNIEGVRAGTQLLATLPARRKIYVSPGLVDQGIETEPVHETMGMLIAAAQPDMVVLMNNSVTPFIERGLRTANFAGEIRIEHNPLFFYRNLDQFVAAGDLVLMQNDWTDNYA